MPPGFGPVSAVHLTTLAELGIKHYGDPLAEVRRCRQDCALFDFSFMSRARIEGPGALVHLNRIQTRDLSAMAAGDIRYCLSASADGVVHSDLTVWKLSDETYDIYSGRPQDIVAMTQGLPDHCHVRDLSAGTAVFSVQGPETLNVLSGISDRGDLAALSYFRHGKIRIDGVVCRVGRLGYTGEKGFEIVVDPPSDARKVWRALMAVARPAGVAAMDMLRIEAGFVLFLNECRLGVNAAELGLGKFSGSGSGPARHGLVCFRAGAREIDMPWSPPSGLRKPEDGEITVTSAGYSGLCEGILGLGFIRNPADSGGVYRDTTGTFCDIRLAPLPYYDPGKAIPRAGW